MGVDAAPNKGTIGMTSTDLVLYELRGSTALLTLNRAERRNALSRGLIQAIRGAFERARDDVHVRCVILTGSGAAFCAGMDLAELQESAAATGPSGPGIVWDDALRLSQLYDCIYALPKPTIAAVNGAAVAGGAGLTTVCDLAVAVPEAKLGYPEVRRGLVAAMVMPHLLRHVGERMARYLLLTGEVIDAATALEAGLLTAVAPQHELLETAFRWAKQIAEGGPLALAKTKEWLRTLSRQALSVEEAAKASAAPRLTQESRDGLAAFFAKQPPPWAPTEAS
jgi:methylglutaconyl-CoA hydratase